MIDVSRGKGGDEADC